MKNKIAPLFFVIAAASAVCVPSASAIVLENPEIHTYNPTTSPSPIDPSGNIKVYAGGSVPTSRLYQIAGFGVIQDFTGFTTGTNTIAFTNPDRADVRIRFSNSGSGGINGSGSELTNNDFLSSDGSGIRWTSPSTPNSVTPMTASITFGTYANGAFDTAVPTNVSAMAFTLNSLSTRFASVESIVVTYYAADGDQLLSTQSVNSFSEIGKYGILFSYESLNPNQFIGRVNIDVKAKAGATTQIIFGIDDLGYTSAIPEPAHVTMMFAAGALAILALRRRQGR